MDKKAFMQLLACTVGDQTDAGVTGVRIVGCESSNDAALEKVEILGDSAILGPEEPFTHVGWQTEDGKYLLNVRVHGKCWLDGRELARLMQSADSECYGGEYDDGHFLYLVKNGAKLPVTSERDMVFLDDIYSLSANVIFTEDRGSSNVTAGLAIMHQDGSTIHLKSASGAAGEQTLVGSSVIGKRPAALVNTYGLAEFELPISYDGTVMTLSGEECDEGYIGYTSTLLLDEPLRGMYSVYGDSIYCDSLDALSGELVRNVFEIKVRPEDLTKTFYGVCECFSIPIPQVPLNDTCISNVMTRVYDAHELFGYYVYCVSPTLDRIYISFGEDNDIESAKETVRSLDISFIMPLATPIHECIESRLENSQPAGQVYVEVCTPADAQVKVLCKK